MIELLNFFAPSLLICFFLVGIHCYLGIHVLKREVIFIDLSLAQVASLGAVVALLFDFEHGSTESYFISLTLTFGAAALFSLGRRVDHVISQEVLIGITYAFASAFSVILLNKLAHGAEHIKEILVGRILWVDYMEVFKVAIIYSLIGVFYYFSHQKLLALSSGKSKNNSLWDFLFFSSFGAVITSSVGVAGVLLVFSFLIVPAFLSSILAKSFMGQLLWGWTIGIVVTCLGMFLSYWYDMPAGAMIVICFTVLPIVFTLIQGAWRKN